LQRTEHTAFDLEKLLLTTIFMDNDPDLINRLRQKSDASRRGEKPDYLALFNQPPKGGYRSQEQIPDGSYRAKVERAELKPLQGRVKLILWYQLVDHETVIIMEHYQRRGPKLRQLERAWGFKFDDLSSVQELVGISCLVKVRRNENQYPRYKVLSVNEDFGPGTPQQDAKLAKSTNSSSKTLASNDSIDTPLALNSDESPQQEGDQP
jgi:hypothetical protein